MAMTLREYLAQDDNTHAREELLNHRLEYDLKLAAACRGANNPGEPEARGYHLLSYYSDVDHDGFDLILDDRDLLRKYQVKSRVLPGGKPGWPVLKSVLRPLPWVSEALGFEPGGPAAEGTQGGVILIDVTTPTDDTLEVAYHFTDVFVVQAIALGALPGKAANTVGAAKNLLAELAEGPSHDKVGVAAGLFVRAQTPGHLLALAGFHCRINVNWRAHLLQASRVAYGAPGALPGADLDDLKVAAKEALEAASGVALG